jgi:hypothetical protein
MVHSRRLVIDREPKHYGTDRPILTGTETAKYSLSNMRKWFISSLLIIALANAAISVSAHADEGSCPMANMPDCCKKAQSANNTPEVSMARLCCNLNCSEPGSGGSSVSSNFSRQQGAVPNSPVVAAAPLFNRIHFRDTYSQAGPHDSNPKYIRHLALLI